MSRYHLFDSFLDAILVVDREGRVFYGNAAASIVLGVSTKRLSTGRSISQFVTFQPDPFKADEVFATQEQASQVREVSYHLQSSQIAASATEGWAQVVFQPQLAFINDPEDKNAGDERRWIICVRDVSVEKTLQVKYRGELDQKEAVIGDLQEARKKLESYSKDLEKMVEARTTELTSANQLLKTILDSLGQGILVFGRDGVCLSIYSQVCRRLLECDPAGKMIEDVLHMQGNDKNNFEKWREAVFDELLDFQDMVPLAPNKCSHSAGLEIALDYQPMYGSDGHLQGIVLVATDRTRETQALRKAERERELVAKVTQVARNREVFRMFVVDARRLLEELKKPENLDAIDVARRLHTLKGAAASFSLVSVSEACHRLEDELKKAGGGDRKSFNQSLKLQVDKVLADLDRELDVLGELLGPIGVGEGSQMVELPIAAVNAWGHRLIAVDGAKHAHEIGLAILRESLEKSVGPSVQYLGPSLIELAESMGKRLEHFEIFGSDVKIPAHFAQSLLSSLVHAFRNSVYHGLEAPADRVKAGKAEGGRIAVKFDTQKVADKPWLVIDISDDGRGVAPAIIRKKLLKQGQDQFAALGDNEVIQAILRDDFSTNEQVNEVAGRGVGLAAIASEARRLGGTVVVHSTEGAGMLLAIRVPFPRGAVEPISRAS